MRRTLALFFTALTAACSGGSDSDAARADDVHAGGLTFHAEAPALPDFKLDTGLQPPGSPAQLRLVASAGGGLTVDAIGGTDGGKLAGRAGSGHVKLDLHVKLEGELNVSTSLKSYAGPIPGLKDVDIPIKGEVAFDPFLTGDGESAKVTADVPETKLPDVPLGAAPGKLQLTIAKGTVVTTTFHGTCAKVEGGHASYAGEAETSGTLVLRAALAFDIPGMKPVDLPATTIAIPKKTIALDLGEKDAGSLADSAAGTCGGKPSSGGAPSGGASGGSPPGSGAAGTATVTIDGVPMHVDGIELWAPNPVNDKAYDVFIKISGPGVREGSDVMFSAAWIGDGCDETMDGNSVAYRPRPEDDTQYLPTATVGCGLSVVELPTAVGKHLRGSFDGDLTGINVANPTTKRVTATFDVPRTK